MHVCTNSGGQLLTLQDIWSVVLNTAVNTDADSVDLWKVVTQQVCITDVLLYSYCNITGTLKIKKVKEFIAVNGTPSHSYGVSLAVWDHTVLPSTRHNRTHPAFTPSRQAGTRFTDHLRVEG